ncbi:uncharacterized protein PHACADRAFT_248017 [Phanerochaete carnosa HHB-10118-sp]|uniref:Uncharacterized protein n=1 Tax=Phanerochaete carnosa (strain HHB-10118-sp) TaxID=650164 RepID=K5WBV9_PHACS|nr:uncharacterized protein PHACADRAFT_248017 [Phanerochaete carnosa HHB-10118-sp]EKM61423.1 hypothetical protein PHACADRAFT_248017 [Phanerochaete carnosa HHB-10118-sp]
MTLDLCDPGDVFSAFWAILQLRGLVQHLRQCAASNRSILESYIPLQEQWRTDTFGSLYPSDDPDSRITRWLEGVTLPKMSPTGTKPTPMLRTADIEKQLGHRALYVLT